MNRWPSNIRLFAIAGAFVVLTGLIGWRLWRLQIDLHEQYSIRARSQQMQTIVIQPQRGEMLDRRERRIATSVARMSVYVDPRELPGDAGAWAGLFAEATGQSYTELISILGRNRPMPLIRRLDRAAVWRVAQFAEQYNIPSNALWFHRESKRRYPRAIAGQVIGFCSPDGDGDNEGISGLELKYNDVLKGERILCKVQRSAMRTTLEPVEENAFAKARGETLVLTIDAALQEAAERILAAHVENAQAASGVVIVQETRTGAILAMCSYPGFDNNNFSQATAAMRRNRAITDPFEPGSTAKIYTMSIVLDHNVMGPDDLVDCHSGFLMIHGRRVVDSPGHTLHVVPLHEVFRWSSNVGAVVAAQGVDPDTYWQALRRFGIGQMTGIDMPGEGSGILRNQERWTAMSMSSLPQGYEMALTPIQAITAVSGIINDGRMMRPYIVAERRGPRGKVVWKAEPQMIREIVRPSTSARLREMMEEVVVGGTGKKASLEAEGYRAGGKTGTTRKSQVLDGREYIASFIGAIPINDPQITVFCSVDAPKNGKYYAADIACPLFKEVALAALAQLAIPPSAPATESGDVNSLVAAASASSKQAASGALMPAGAAASGAVAVRQEVQPGQMPDLTGMTMAEARQALRGVAGEVQFLGSGVVVDQSPSPGTPLEGPANTIVVFRNAQKRSEENEAQAPHPAASNSTSSSGEPVPISG